MHMPFTTRRTFTISLQGRPCQVEASISHTAYEIGRISANGCTVTITLDDLEIIEAHIDASIQTTETEAYNFTSGRMERFQVVSHQGSVLAVIDTGGYSLPRHSPQFSEAAEAFALDQEYAEAVESDAPHVAAAAGFLRPVPVPQNAGVGNRYRRAA